ncbi:hypothetical protein EZH22_24180 [Xanthobacter dioxanivorans]|uniref:Hydantoinase B/oxoprolinase domain-containing protein n=1 Tax=Xanthobacter dioxanivorans TaxID=2528964 RepID=A0A974PM33_9HYPH|nr:hypothetical protein [Xanthobacter dioxanivorans]QRG06059.1 hypothetical protein EZH22_24180 [Xanthobacter dioxanivorans]
MVSFRLSGAGGYGDPAARDLEKIREDLKDGYMTPAGIERDYPGVAFEAEED